MEHGNVSGLYRPDADDSEEPSSFRWDAHYVTGLTDVDAQHRHLVHVLNQLGGLLTRPERPSSGEVEAIFADLAAYAVYHFEEEEAPWASPIAKPSSFRFLPKPAPSSTAPSPP